MDKQEILTRAQAYIEQESQEEFRSEVELLLREENLSELEERFYTDLNFGTGGIRGIMGGGYNRINPFIIQRTTQGLARYILSRNIPSPSVAIAYDSRHNSPLFAKVAAEVLAAHNIRVYLFSGLRPTPELSFALRRLGCTSGIVCTASHNPPKYNGYKVYWQDGAQIVYPEDKGIIAEVRSVRPPIQSMKLEDAINNGLVTYIDSEIDDAYVEMVKGKIIRQEVFTSQSAKNLKIVYTPLHGTGAKTLERITQELGLSIDVVPEQREPDGNFPTVKFPNPEEASAMKMALDRAKALSADLIIGTDPDADRIGIGIKQDGEFHLLNGNQHGVLLCDYVLGSLAELGKLPERPAFVNTIVSTDLQRKIARAHGAEVHECLTGFKWIASKIREFEENDGPTYVLGGEESYGFMIGTDVRDKDSMSASALTIEMAMYYKEQGKTLIDRLIELFSEFGVHLDSLKSKYFEGKNGTEIMNSMMQKLRSNPPKSIGGIAVDRMRDILDGTTLELRSGKKNKDIDLPSSNVLQFFLEDGSVLSARPSGTEPKIKFYTGVLDTPGKDLQKSYDDLNEKIKAINSFIDSIIEDASH